MSIVINSSAPVLNVVSIKSALGRDKPIDFSDRGIVANVERYLDMQSRNGLKEVHFLKFFRSAISCKQYRIFFNYFSSCS